MVHSSHIYPLPFMVKLEPVFRLAIVEFQNNKNEIYISYELQYIHDVQENKGYRLLCYRKDKYVDVYEQNHLIKDSDISLDITENGLGSYIQTEFSHIVFDIRDELLYMSFSFVDKFNRLHQVEIAEGTTKKTRPFDLLAPLGDGLKQPKFLPIFFLYDFDFLRKKRTRVKIGIDKKKMRLKNFIYPLPKDGQWRYYTRFAKSTQILAFLPISYKEIEEILVKDKVYHTQYLTYFFVDSKDGVALQKIMVKTNPAVTSIVFSPALTNMYHLTEGAQLHGTFQIQGARQAGEIAGCYHMRRNKDRVGFELTPKDGYLGISKTAFTKLIFQENSVFHQWPKTYHYDSVIDIHTKQVAAVWNRLNNDKKG